MAEERFGWEPIPRLPGRRRLARLTRGLARAIGDMEWLQGKLPAGLDEVGHALAELQEAQRVIVQVEGFAAWWAVAGELLRLEGLQRLEGLSNG
jgi:hypothetical protein